jgi:hypothetical protein
MSRDVLLATDMIANLLRPGATEGDAEEAALRLANIEERLASSDHERLRLTGEAVPLVVDDLPPQGWIWLMESLSEKDAELDDRLLNQLYFLYPDLLLRLRFVDAALSHPLVVDRFAGMTADARGERSVRLKDLPGSWPGRWLTQRLAPPREHTEGAEPSPAPAEAVVEMSLYLFQVGTDAALAVLAALMNEDDERVAPAREQISQLVVALRQNGVDVPGL